VRRSEIVVGIDLGTTRIKVVAADVSAGGLPEILGTGDGPSDGVDAGVIVNIERAAEAIRAAVGAAERNADLDIGRVVLSLDGEHVRCLDSRGVIAVTRTGGEITQSEIAASLEAARTLALPVGRVVVDVVPQEYFVDGQGGVRDPVGMSCVRLGSKVHVVTASQPAVDNAVRAARRAGLKVGGVALKPLAAAAATLTDDEKDLGVICLHLSGGTTGMVLYHDGAPRHTAVVGWGSSSITSDIAVGLRVPVQKAEQLKRERGWAAVSMADDLPVEIPSTGGRPPRQSSTQMLAAIIEPRLREILEMAMQEAKGTEYWGRVLAGVVLTGGGAKLKGVTEVAEDVFGAPARVGLPDRASGKFEAIGDPAFAAAVGIVSGSSPGAAHGMPEKPLAETVHKVRQWVDSLL
jgi:cell division protein FtsA